MSGRGRPEVAIVGAGLVGRWHARYSRSAGGRVVAVVDADGARAETLARDFPGARVFADLDECLKATPASVIHVCTDDDHALLADRVLAAGRHAVVEKPVSRGADEARHLVDMAIKLRLVLCPVHQYVFQRGFGRLLARRERLGEIVRIEGTVCTGVEDGLGPAERRDVLVATVPHFVSLFRALVGPVAAVSWHVLAFSPDELALVTRAGTAQLSLFASLRGRPPRSELLVVGTERSARVDLLHGHCVWEAGGLSRAAKVAAPFRHAAVSLSMAAVNLAGRALRREPALPGLRALIAAAYRAVKQGGPPPVPPEEIVEAAELMERLLKSARA
jgi:predicted dehydrogenase